MRIECERCQAVFSVDDARIPAAGARAACPKCSHQVVVRRAGESASAPESIDPFAVLPTREPTPGPGSSPFELMPPTTGEHPLPPDPLAASLSEPAPIARQSQPLPPDPLERDGPQTGEFAIAEADPTTTRMSGPTALPPDPLERDGLRTGEFAVPDAATAAMSSAAGRITGQFPVPKLPEPPPASPPPSPFPDDMFADAARTTSARPITMTSTLGKLAAEAARWRVRKQEGLVEGPFSGADLTERWDAGLIQPTDLVSKDGGPFQGLTAQPFTAAFLSERGARRVKAFASSERGPLPWRAILAVLAVVLGGVFGALLFSLRPSFLFAPKRPAADTSALAIVDTWRRREGVPSASEKDLVRLARGYQASDTPEGRERAAEAFRRVLVLDPENLNAMARFAEVTTVDGTSGDEVTGREAAELLAYALRHGHQLAEPHAARAAFLTKSGSASDLVVAQSEAQTALQLDPKSPSALIAWSRAFLRTNAELALEKVEDAEKLAPDDRRALLVQGDALFALGRIAEARAAFQKRSELVPDDPTSMLELVRLDVSVGRFDDAKAQLADAEKRAPKSAELAVMHAMLSYEVDGDLAAARAELEATLARPLDRLHRLQALVHAAAVAEEQERLPEAEALVKEGLALDGASAPLGFRLALLKLDEGRPDEARTLLDKVGALMPDQAQRALVSARIDAALGKVDVAQRELSQATTLAPLRIDGYLLAAALYAQVGASEQALALAHRGLQADPEWAKTHVPLTDFHETRQGAFDTVIGGLSTLAIGGDDEGLTLAAEAMARYHAGDLAGAEKDATKALATGEGALAANAYLAQLALDRKDAADALAHAHAALEADRTSALASYETGRALALYERWEEAHAKFRDALEEDPNFLPALVHDADALDHLGRRGPALDELKKAYRYDPDDVETRRALEKLGAPGGESQATTKTATAP